MTPRVLPLLSLVACAARPAPSAPSFAPRHHAAPEATPEAAPVDPRTLATRARCTDARLALVSPAPVTEMRCPWGAPACVGEASVVVRNCTRGPVKLTALTVEGSDARRLRTIREFAPEAYGPLDPATELRVPFPIDPEVETLRVRVDLARSERGAPETLRATTAIRRDVLLAPGTGEAFGDGATVYAVEAAPDGRWVALCVWRGQEVVPSLWREGAATAIDDLLGADPSGRFVALVVQGRAVLRDTATDREVALDVGDAPPALTDVSFDALGQHVAYLRRRGGRVTVVVRTLATAREAEVDPGGGKLWRAHIDEGGAWVRLEVIARDTDGDGHLSAPHIEPPPPTRWCQRRVLSCIHGYREYDALETRVAPASGGAAAAVPGLLRPLGEALLVRAPDGALELVDARGGRTELVPASCGAQLLDGDGPRQQVAVLCAHEARGDLAPAAFYTSGLRRETGAFLSLQAAALRASYETPPRTFYDGGHTWVVEHAGAALHRFPGDHSVRWAADGRAIMARGDAVTLFDAALGILAPLPFDSSTFEWPRGRGPVVWSGSTLVDVARREVLGRVAGDVLAVTTDGRALVPAVPADDGRRYASGPLRWVRPTP